MGIIDNLKKSYKDKADERKKLKALEKSAYLGEKKKVDAATKARKAEEAVKREQAKARQGGSSDKLKSVAKKVDTWAERKAKEQKAAGAKQKTGDVDPFAAVDSMFAVPAKKKPAKRRK